MSISFQAEYGNTKCYGGCNGSSLQVDSHSKSVGSVSDSVATECCSKFSRYNTVQYSFISKMTFHINKRQDDNDFIMMTTP